MKHVAYVWSLLKYAFRNNPGLYASVLISLASSAIELLAMTSLMPLFQMVSGAAAPTTGINARLLVLLGFPITPEALLWEFIVLFGSRIATQLAGTSLSTLLGKRVMAQLCTGAFDQIIHRLSIREVSAKSIGFYISLAGDESFRASTLVVSMTQFFSIGALAALYYGAIYVYSAAAAGFVALFMGCAAIVMVRVVRLSHRLGTRQSEGSRKAGTLFLDALNNIKTVRSFSAERYVVEAHRGLMAAYARILFWVDEVALLTRLVPILLLFILFSAWLAFSGRQLAGVGIAFIVTMIVLLMRFFPVLGQAVNLMIKIASDARSGRDVTAIVDLPALANAGTRSLDAPISVIQMSNVCFAYDPAEKRILNEVSLEFRRGTSYALAGRSGLGKSTLVDILLKYLEPDSGHVSVNGVPLAQLADSGLRQRMILVSQEPAIFDDTVRNNVCMGMAASAAEVEQACRMAQIHDVIAALPAGYETRLQYRGSNLSGGQRQRIAIARALLRRPEVLILDEGTSALDKQTQQQVLDNILAADPGRILILVTHDPLLLERVDQVFDLEVLNRAAQPSAATAGVGTR